MVSPVLCLTTRAGRDRQTATAALAVSHIVRQPHDPASQSLVLQNQHEALLPALPRQLRAAGEVTTGSAGESPSVTTKNSGFTREQKGNSMPAQALEEAKHPIDFSLPVRFVPLHSFLSLSPLCGRRGHVSHGLAVTLGHKAQPPEPRTAGEPAPAPAGLSGYGAGGSAQGSATTASNRWARSDIGNTCSLERKKRSS